ncbi:MAG: hypothetical protein AMJ89_01205 [candidate division Zixibacteria bacterium SM23_73]|nr:MAG: hypothetical protein AMJ89_01205 [candidate division Zixibacteria bacterium SM23_73]
MDNVNRIRVGFFTPDFTLKDSESKGIRLSIFLEKRRCSCSFIKEKNVAFVLVGWTSLPKPIIASDRKMRKS